MGRNSSNLVGTMQSDPSQCTLPTLEHVRDTAACAWRDSRDSRATGSDIVKRTGYQV